MWHVVGKAQEYFRKRYMGGGEVGTSCDLQWTCGLKDMLLLRSGFETEGACALWRWNEDVTAAYIYYNMKSKRFQAHYDAILNRYQLTL